MKQELPKIIKYRILKSSLIVLLGIACFSIFIACNEDDIPEIQDDTPELPKTIDENLYRFGVNTNPYEYFDINETPVPDGYTPFYISAYLRHGSRGNVGTNYAPVIEAFSNAHNVGVLNTEGERAFEQIKAIFALDNGTDGNLTARGAREHKQIANRMFSKYRNLFLSGTSRIRAVSSTSPRCQESMNAFIDELNLLNSQLYVDSYTGNQYMAYMSSAAPAEVKAVASEKYKEYLSLHDPDTTYFASHVFSDMDAGRDAIGGSIEKVMSGVMSFAAISGAYDLDKTLINLFQIEDLRHYSRALSQYIYICQCNSIEYGNLSMAVRGVGALIEDFVDKTDSVILEGEYVADLRFGHDSQLMSFCAKIGLKGIGERLSIEEGSNWLGWLYTPFAANFYMVFYKNESGNVLVKCFINEHESTLLGLSGGPYYTWDNLKEYLNSLLLTPNTRGGITDENNTSSDVNPDIIVPIQ